MLDKIKRVALNIIKSVVKFITDIWSKIIKKINELKERFKNNPQIQSLLSKINNSRMMQTLNIAKRNKPRVERANSVEEVEGIKEELSNARDIQQEEAEKAKGIFSKIKETIDKKSEKNNPEWKWDSKNPERGVSNVTRKYTAEGNIIAIRSSLITAIHMDENFEKGYFWNSVKYVENNIESSKRNQLFEPYDGEPLISASKDKFTEEDFVNAIVELKGNFCRKRVEDVKKIGKTLH